MKNLRKLLLIFVSLMLIITVVVIQSDDQTDSTVIEGNPIQYGGVNYYVIQGNNVQAGNGEAVDLDSGGVGTAFSGTTNNIIIPSIFIAEGIEYNVVSIGDYAFADSSIKKLVVEASEISIGSYAFYNCSNLKTVKITGSVTSIGDNAFEGAFTNDNQCSFTAVGSDLTIGSYAFQNCSNLKTVDITGSVTSIGDNAFEGAFTNDNQCSFTAVGSDLTIGSKVFYNCSKLYNVTITGSVTSIGDNAFEGAFTNDNYSSFTIYGSVEDSGLTIGSQAFKGCNKLINFLIIGFKVTIGTEAFISTPIVDNGVYIKMKAPPGYTSTGAVKDVKENGSIIRTYYQPDDVYEITLDLKCTIVFILHVEYVSVPIAPHSQTYTGSVLESGFANTDEYIVSGNIFATNVDTYFVTFTLRENYIWSDGTTAPKIIGWEISALQLTVTGTATKVYDGNTDYTTFAVGNIASGDTVHVTGAFNSATVAEATSILFTMTGDDAGNYIVPVGIASASITKANITVDASAGVITYGDALPTFTATVTGIKSPMVDAVYTVSSDYVLYGNVGKYTITATPGNNPNYNIASNLTAILDVQARELTSAWDQYWTASEYTGVYDGTEHIATATIGNIVSSDQVGFVYMTNTITNAGTITATISGLTGSESGNYVLPSNLTQVCTIDKADNTLAILITGWTYGKTISSPSATTNTSGGSVTYDYKIASADDNTYTETVPTAVGAYTIRGTSDATLNYNSASATATFSITPYVLAIGAQSMMYNGQSIYTFDVDGINDEILTVTYTASSSSVGKYVYFSGDVSTVPTVSYFTAELDSNYVLKTVGDFTITAVPVGPVDPVTYNVTFSQPANGTITATVNGVEIQSGASVLSGTIVLFTASFGGETEIDANWYVTVDNVADTESYVGASLMYVISGDTYVYAEIHVIPNEPAEIGTNFFWWILLISVAIILIGSFVYLRHRSGA